MNCILTECGMFVLTGQCFLKNWRNELICYLKMCKGGLHLPDIPIYTDKF